MWLVSMAAAYAACADDALDNEGFRDALARGWEVLQAGDEDAFRDTLREAETSIPCLPAPITPDDAARFHRNRAVASKLTGDPEGARTAAAASLRLDPALAAEWGVQVADYASLIDDMGAPGPRVEFVTSLAARVYSDGEPVAARWSGQPVVVQVFSPEGPPVGGAFIDARNPMPDWVAYPQVQCPQTVAIEALVESVEVAQVAFTELDVQRFEEALRDIATGLPCVEAALLPTQAAAIHRLEGLRLYTSGSRLGALRSFQESRMLDGAYQPDGQLIREGSSLQILWDRAGTTAAPPWIDAEVPEGLPVRVDGIEARQRPATLPSIMQVFSPTGEELWTRYIPAAAPLPDLSRFAITGTDEELERLPPALRLYRQDRRDRRRSNIKRGLQLGGAALVASAGWMYGVNADHAADFRAAGTDPKELPRLRGAVNRSGGACALLLTAGAVGIGASFVIR